MGLLIIVCLWIVSIEYSIRNFFDDEELFAFNNFSLGKKILVMLIFVCRGPILSLADILEVLLENIIQWE